LLEHFLPVDLSGLEIRGRSRVEPVLLHDCLHVRTKCSRM
jgi:hypothetical protein